MADSENLCYVYIITDPRDNLVKYVGITTNPKNRFCKHRSDKQNGEGILKKNWVLKLKQLGLEPVFEIIDKGSIQYCMNAETNYIKLYTACGAILKNKCKNGLLNKHTDETKEKIRQQKLGVKLTEQQKLNLKNRNCKYWLGKNLSEEHKKKLSDKAKGRISCNKNILKYDVELIKKIKSDYIPYVFGSIKLSKKYNIPTTTIERYLKLNIK
jgi:hypothetical protein